MLFSYWIKISWFVQFIIIDVKPMLVWERLAVASLLFIFLCGSLPSSINGKIIRTNKQTISSLQTVWGEKKTLLCIQKLKYIQCFLFAIVLYQPLMRLSRCFFSSMTWWNLTPHDSIRNNDILLMTFYWSHFIYRECV